MRKLTPVIEPDLGQAVLITALVWLFAFGFQGLVELGLNGTVSVQAVLDWSPVIAAHILLALVLYPTIVATDPLPTKWRFALLALAIFLVGLAETSVQIIDQVMDGRRKLADFANSATWRVGIGPQILFFIYIIAFNAVLIILMRSNARHGRRVAAAEAAASKAQLLALRYQINPHFLFNTLNAISSLVVTRETDQADEMITRLSTYLRSSLAAAPDSMVSLADEFAAAEAYLDIEAVRFEDRLSVKYDLPKALEGALVPSLILQPLIENAVKYGAAASKGPSTVHLTAEQSEDHILLSVTNLGGGPSQPVAPGTGVGLENVRQRLAAVFGDAGKLTAGPTSTGWRSVVRVPASQA